jgi:DNA-binding CsgD family transcriptional regulator
MDRHYNLAQYNWTVEEAAEAHLRDLKCQAEFGCNYLTYYLVPKDDTGFCLVEAPTAEAASACHVAAHGEAASRIIEVTREAVEAFLGEIRCPAPGESWAYTGFRAILCATLGQGDLLPAVGQLRASELAAEYDRLVRQLIEDHGGISSRYLAGTFFGSFTTSVRAVECALAIRQATTPGPNAIVAELDVRCGVAAGEPVEETGDFFAIPMEASGRMAAASRPHDVRVSRVVAELCAGRFSFRPAGEVELSSRVPVSVYQVESPVGRSSSLTPTNQANLTGREIEVLKMIARGRTNQEIATALVISPNTVARHVSNILDKTGVANRTEAATYAAERGYH